MRLKISPAAATALLLGSTGLSFGMGSGPHPHLLIAIPPSAPPSPSDPASGVFLVLLVAVLGVLVYFARRKRTPDSLSGISPNT